jgi:hypothetical protein
VRVASGAPPNPFQPTGVGGAELFAEPDAYTAAYHDARARALESRAVAAGNRALADAFRRVARRHRATALALAAAPEPAGRRRGVPAWPGSVSLRSFAPRTSTAPPG